jgi:hypothetical protein
MTSFPKYFIKHIGLTSEITQSWICVWLEVTCNSINAKYSFIEFEFDFIFTLPASDLKSVITPLNLLHALFCLYVFYD